MSSDRKYAAIGARLRALREALYGDLSMKQFAEMMGLDYRRYHNWEAGSSRPQPEEAINLCDKLGATLDFIYRGREAALPQSTVKLLASRSRDR